MWFVVMDVKYPGAYHVKPRDCATGLHPARHPKRSFAGHDTLQAALPCKPDQNRLEQHCRGA